jgi:uncharacterized protein
MSQLAGNSSPLISLAAAGALPLLQHVADEIVVPPQVWQECVVEGAGRPGADEIATAGWIRQLPVVDRAYVERLHREIDLGESEAIALARQLGTPVLIDERRGRAVARREGVAVIGTAGVLLRLKQEGVIPLVRPTIERLVAAGWRISDGLFRGVLQSAGE